MSKDVNYIKLINTKKWKQLRLSKLRNNPLCEKCQGSVRKPAEEVHHITPVEVGVTIGQMEELMFNYDNLMSVCHTCHVAIHKEMFSHSKKTVQNANNRRTKRFNEKYL